MYMLTETLPALRAPKGFLSSVDPLVRGKVYELAKLLSALQAGKWLLPRVHCLVRREDATLTEAFPAL